MRNPAPRDVPLASLPKPYSVNVKTWTVYLEASAITSVALASSGLKRKETNKNAMKVRDKGLLRSIVTDKLS